MTSEAGLDAARERALRIATNRAAALGRAARWLLHQVRNPVQVLSLAPDLLEIPEERFRLGAMLRDGTHELTEGLDLLDPLIRTGSAPLPLVPTELHAPLRYLARLYASHRAPTRLEIDEPPGLPAVRAAEPYLVHVLLNLLLNALAAQSDRTDGWITLRAEAAGGTVVLTMRDGGPGVAAEAVPRLFTPFSSTREGGPLLGLGLYVARELAREMGGDLRWEGGSTFALTLQAWG